MADEFARAKDLYEWDRRILVVMGAWPLQSTYVTFTVWITYLVIHMSMEFVDLYQVFGNLDLMILNLSETTLETMIILKLIVIRFSKTLVKVMTNIAHEVDAMITDTPEEKEIYLNYNRIAKTFFKLWVTMGTVASILYHVKPLEFRLRAALGNESIPFVLPYRARLFFEVNDSLTFWLVWIYQIPMIYINMIHSMTIGYLFSLVLHVCGMLSVLAFRIKNLDRGLRENDQTSASIIFRDLVGRHRNIVDMAKDVDQVFNVILLEELIISTVILGLTSYTVLLNADYGDFTVLISFFVYGFAVMSLIYGYCVAGEYLITESTNVYDAYYQCQWYDLSSTVKKQLIICIISASKPLQLTGGGFYIFCLGSFASVLKTSMGYMSMLRKMI